MAKADNRLTMMEWLGLAGALLSASVCVTAFLFINFEQKSDAKDREARIISRMDEFRENQKVFMERLGVDYKASVKQ